MIYYKKDFVQFPRHSSESSNEMTIINELTDEAIKYSFVDMSTDARYYMINLALVDLKDGTYRYQIGPEVGLLQVGDYIAPSTEYNEKKQNTVYER